MCYKFTKKKKSIGFLCKIPSPDKNNLLPILVVNKNLINENKTEENKIIINLKDENKEICIYLKNKIIYKNEFFDIAFIEITEENFKEDNYFELDEIIVNKSIKEVNIYNNIYTLKYKKEKIYISLGELREILEVKDNIYSFSQIKLESNIFPIINHKNNKLIGIHINNNPIYNQNLLDLLKDFNNFIEIKYYIPNAINEITDKKEFIASGGFGKVYKIKYKEKIYALKQIPFENIKEEDKKDIFTEPEILSKIDNENIVKYYYSYKKENIFNIIMEFCDTNLELFIKKFRTKSQYIDEKIIINIIKQICIGLIEIHKLNIIHRDLKPENIFINEKNLKIKIGDFNISKISIYAHSGKGTFKYMSPEIRAGKKYNNKIDMYALGCIIYELFTLNNYSDDKDFKNIQKVNLDFYAQKWQKLIDSLLEIDYHKRPSVEEVLKYLDK